MTIVENGDYLMAKGRRFPKVGTRKQLEECGAIYLESKFQNGESGKEIERMVFENTTYAIVWDKINSGAEEPFKVHYYTEDIKKPNR